MIPNASNQQENAKTRGSKRATTVKTNHRVVRMAKIQPIIKDDQR